MTCRIGRDLNAVYGVSRVEIDRLNERQRGEMILLGVQRCPLV